MVMISIVIRQDKQTEESLRRFFRAKNIRYDPQKIIHVAKILNIKANRLPAHKRNSMIARYNSKYRFIFERYEDWHLVNVFETKGVIDRKILTSYN